MIFSTTNKTTNKTTNPITLITDNVIYNIAKETARLLNTKQKELSYVKWNSGESNLDSEYSQLACNCCNEAWKTIKMHNSIYNNVGIECNIPDINLKFVFPGGDIVIKKIELKSSTSTKMSGSTIKKLDINQPLIYCLRPKNNNGIYNIRCSQYHSAMGDSDTDLFQDRTPRPCLNFKKMNDYGNEHSFENKRKGSWVHHYARCALNRIEPNTQCKVSWQDDLLKNIKNDIIDEFIKNTTVDNFVKMKI
tara:strand:+ start:178 stop:924 length:747 start_codon:yes stop_codon:yes gene_type:complete